MFNRSLSNVPARSISYTRSEPRVDKTDTFDVYAAASATRPCVSCMIKYSVLHRSCIFSTFNDLFIFLI